MATRTRVEFIDDLDGSPIPDGEGGTVSFALRGVTYEIDLGAKSAAKLEEALAPFIAAGHKATKAVSARSQQRTSPEDLKLIREWANANGYTVSDRGRVPGPVREAYDAAH